MVTRAGHRIRDGEEVTRDAVYGGFRTGERVQSDVDDTSVFRALLEKPKGF